MLIVNRSKVVVRNRILSLDGLRGFAIIWVVCHNGLWVNQWKAASLFGRLLTLISGMGWLGVQLFFVLSGFLITGILLDERKLPNRFRNFYFRRLLRIFPIYYGALTCFLFLFPFFNLSHDFGINQPVSQLWYWLFLANWSIPTIGGPGGLSHFWSLAVEEQFYLLWPFAASLLNRNRLLQLCTILIFSSLIGRWLLIQHGLEYAMWRAYEFTYARWDALAIGALSAVIVRDQGLHAIMKKLLPKIMFGSGVYIVAYVGLNRSFPAVDDGIAVMNQTVAALFFASLMLLTIVPTEGWSAKLSIAFSNGFLRHIGKHSYAIYVFHYPLLEFFDPDKSISNSVIRSVVYSFPAPCRVLTVAFISYALSIISWHLIEMPFLRMRRFGIDRG